MELAGVFTMDMGDIFPAEGVLGLKVPTGDYDSKTNLTYLFLVPDDLVKQLHDNYL